MVKTGSLSHQVLERYRDVTDTTQDRHQDRIIANTRYLSRAKKFSTGIIACTVFD